MTEIFDEVSEEVRLERLKKLWERYSIVIVALAVLVVAGVGGWRGYQYWQAKQAAQAGAEFEAAVALSDQDKPAEAEAAFAKIAASGSRGYQALALLRNAAEIGKRDPAAAVKAYDDAAANSSLDAPLQDLARVRAAGLLLDTASYDDIRKRLEPLAAADRTFRHSAREILALSAWRNNDMTAARQWAGMIADDAQTPTSLRNRAEALQALLPPAAKS